MGIAELYLAFGLFTAILILIGIWTDSFDEAFEEATGQRLSIPSKIFMVALTIFIWPYTIYRMVVIMREDNE